MKKIIGLLTAGLFSSLIASEYISAVKVNADLRNVSPDAGIWKNANFNSITLYPQSTIRFNDKKAIRENALIFSKVAKVGALYNKNDIAFLIKWPDGSKSIQTGTKTDEYPDGFAVQFPVKYEDPEKLPYIGMGSEGRPVVVHLQKAVIAHYEPNGNGNVAAQVNTSNTNYFNEELDKFNRTVETLAVTDYQRAFVAEGFRSMTEIKDGTVRFTADMEYNSDNWSGTLTRPLQDGYLDLKKGDAFPVAFAVWEGGKKNRDGLKLLSSWIPVKLVNSSDANKYVASVNEDVKGDAKRGKRLALDNCAACHIMLGSCKVTPNQYMAPNLRDIGGYSTAAYLKESIMDPNAVVVPGYNRNYHPNTPWYSLDEKGNRISAMPPYDWMPAEDINDIIAFLQTAKTEVE
jgi:complex iron-sulfur molybdoenzyme family reductase subunit gamma